MHFEMSAAVRFNLVQSNILLSGKGLKKTNNLHLKGSKIVIPYSKLTLILTGCDRPSLSITGPLPQIPDFERP